MGNTCACIRHSEVVSHSKKGSAMESGHNETAAADFGGERGSSSVVGPVRCEDSESLERATMSGKVKSDVEKQIESSKVHWSQLTEQESGVEDEEVVQENRQVFEELQLHPTWGAFFQTFGYETKHRPSSSELVVEKEKFAEGGQAELFHAKVIWRYQEKNEEDLERGCERVLKVFKKGTHLRELQSQWPVGYLQWWAQDLERLRANLLPETQYNCDVRCGTLLEDGRFAFLMVKEHGDLCTRIDCAMLDNGSNQGPFSKNEVERIMFKIAQSMDWLHSHNIVHRDLKASNVLVYEPVGYQPTYYVADFECSIGVVGTGFFRAPEILQATKDKVVGKYPKVFSKEADVYSYGMTCYEVLIGGLPFQGHPLNDYDLVFNGHRPIIPGHVKSWMRKLLNSCWNEDCSKRPLFQDILKILSSNSASVRMVQIKDQEFKDECNRKHKKRLLQQGLVVELK